MLWKAVFLNPIAGNAGQAGELITGLHAETLPIETFMDSDALPLSTADRRAAVGLSGARFLDPALADD